MSRFLGSVIYFLVCPWGLIILGLAGSIVILVVERNVSIEYLVLPLNDLLLIVTASYMLRSKWSKFVSALRSKEFLLSKKYEFIAYSFLITKIGSLILLISLGAVGDGRHEILNNNRILSLIDTGLMLGLQIFILSLGQRFGFIALISMLMASIFLPISKGGIIIWLVYSFIVYNLKLKYFMGPNLQKISVLSFSVIVGLVPLFLIQMAEAISIDSSKILIIVAKRLFFHADIYNDIENFPKDAILSENISPLVFLEPITKFLNYDETPLGTIGSILRSGESIPQIVTGGTPYASSHFVAFGGNIIYIVLGILFAWAMVIVLVYFANSGYWPLCMTYPVVTLPLYYVSDYSGMTMNLILLLVISLGIKVFGGFKVS